MFHLKNDHQSQLNEITASYLGPLSFTSGLVMSIYSIINFLGLSGYSNPTMMFHSTLIALFAFATSFLCVRKKVPLSLAHPVLTILMLMLASLLLHAIYQNFQPILTLLFMMFYLVIGNFFLSLPWASLTIVISAAGWFFIGSDRIARAEFTDYSLAMTAVILTSLMLAQNRISRNSKLITLHHKDKEARQKLAESIEETKREIVERQKAETEQNRLETQLRQAQKLEAVGRLAGGVAHDINNMLAAISGTTEALLHDFAAQKHVTDDLENILEACNRGKLLTLNLLGFAQKGKYRREQIDLNQLIHDVQTFMARTIPDHIWFETFLSKNLPPIEGDPGQINQVLVNLINNAVDAMEVEGHLIITTETVSEIERQGVNGLENAPGKYIKIIVSDTGQGMQEGTIERAFEPFFSTKKMGEGTGLGLSMVYGTITNHGGAVLIRSAENQGTAVTIYLPEYTRNTLRIAVENSEVPGRLEQQGHILLVDDEPLVRKSGKRILSQLGFSVVEASSGEEAIRKYRNTTPNFDAVLLDLIMPGMEGDEVFRRLKESDPEVKVIFVSAYSRETIRVDNLLAEGAIDFIQKPFSIGEINTAIQTAVAVPVNDDSSIPI